MGYDANNYRDEFLNCKTEEEAHAVFDKAYRAAPAGTVMAPLYQLFHDSLERIGAPTEQDKWNRINEIADKVGAIVEQKVLVSFDCEDPLEFDDIDGALKYMEDYVADGEEEDLLNEF